MPKDEEADLDPDTTPEPQRGYHHFPWAIILFSIIIMVLVVLVFVVGHRSTFNKLIVSGIILFYWAIGLLIMHRCTRTGNNAGLWVSFLVLLGLAVITFIFF
jgi:small-conductance mechanosensitive channel